MHHPELGVKSDKFAPRYESSCVLEVLFAEWGQSSRLFIDFQLITLTCNFIDLDEGKSRPVNHPNYSVPFKKNIYMKHL